MEEARPEVGIAVPVEEVGGGQRQEEEQQAAVPAPLVQTEREESADRGQARDRALEQVLVQHAHVQELIAEARPRRVPLAPRRLVETEAVARPPELDVPGEEGVAGGGPVEGEERARQRSEASGGERHIDPPAPADDFGEREASHRRAGREGTYRPAEEAGAEGGAPQEGPAGTVGLFPADEGEQGERHEEERRRMVHEARAHEEEEGREEEERRRDPRHRLAVYPAGEGDRHDDRAER